MPVAFDQRQVEARLAWKCFAEERPARVLVADRRAHRARAPAEPPLGRHPSRSGLDHQPGLVARAKLLVGCGGDPRAAVGEQVDEPLGGEPAQRLAHRRPRDAELARQVLLMQARAALDLAAGDPLAQHRIDLVGDALDLETRSLRSRLSHG